MLDSNDKKLSHKLSHMGHECTYETQKQQNPEQWYFFPLIDEDFQ